MGLVVKHIHAFVVIIPASRIDNIKTPCYIVQNIHQN